MPSATIGTVADLHGNPGTDGDTTANCNRGGDTHSNTDGNTHSTAEPHSCGAADRDPNA
jgi:hypothetical protein